ncbi:YhhN-like [Fusarium oxysporum f. sp. vasinfectum]|nr:YhhN-like [Fusarium oxysporum f. sp. vasinfectum]
MQPGKYILASSLGAAVLYGIKARATPSYSRMASKTLAVSLLAILVTALEGPRYLLAALAFGSLGDAFLAWDSETAFLGRTGSFLISHFFYIALFVENGAGQLLLGDQSRTAIAVSAALLGPVMLTLLIPRVSSELRLPVSLYTCAILGMVFSALTIEIDKTTLGAVLFTTSDTILASGKFLVSASSSHQAWMDYAVWILYYSGQFMIMMGTLERAGIQLG